LKISRRSRPVLVLAVVLVCFLSFGASVGSADDVAVDQDPVDVESVPGPKPEPEPESQPEPDPDTTSAEPSPSPPPSPDSHSSPPPPIGTRFATALDGGQLRLAYSFERIRARQIFVGSRDRTQSEVLAGFYEQAPEELDVTIHNFELAYAPHPRVTLVLNLPFVVKELRGLSETEGRSETQTKGFGDLEFTVIVPFIRKGRESSQVHVGFRAPTGSIRRGGDLRREPYDLQIGNGTWDLEWGWTYRGERDTFSWGAQLIGVHPVGTNGLHYREGSRFNASMWSGVKIVGGLSVSLRLGLEKRNNIRGFDRSLDLAADGPSSNDKARGGFRVDLSPGLSLEIPELNHQTLSVEFGLPVHHDLDGPQLGRDWSLKAGWQWVF
jgi:hypothetical protein